MLVNWKIKWQPFKEQIAKFVVYHFVYVQSFFTLNYTEDFAECSVLECLTMLQSFTQHRGFHNKRLCQIWQIKYELNSSFLQV